MVLRDEDANARHCARVTRVLFTMSAGRGFPALLPWIAAGVGLLATVLILYPGQYPFDSAYQWWQARSGQFNNQSPVAMTALWWLMLRFTANPATLFCLNLAMFWTGLALCFTAVRAHGAVRIALLFICGMAPLALVEMAHLLTDAHLAAVLVLATGLAAWGLAEAKRAALVASLALLLYAGVVRYNALAAIIPPGVVIATALSRGRANVWRTRLLAATSIVCLPLVTGVALDRALTTQRVTVWPTIALWDLAAVSVDTGTLLLPSYTHGQGLSVDELRETGAFDPTANTFLFQATRSGMRDGLLVPYTPEQLRALRRTWIDAMRHHPLAYARHRLRTFRLLVGPHRGPKQAVPYFVSRTRYQDNPPLPAALDQRLQDRFYAFASTLRPSWMFAALPYLILALVALVVGWKRRDQPVPRLGAAVAGGALLYAVALLPLAPAADLRYLTWPIVAGPLVLALVLFGRSPRESDRAS
jgi:hypothetical protein